MKYNEELALRGVSLDVARGEFVALAGPSGSGKSTVLNLAAGLDRPTRGEILLLGRDANTLSSTQLTALRRKEIGIVFQAYNLFPVLTVLENVEYPLAINGVKELERKRRAFEALKAVGLEKFCKRFPNELSGGQQQRVAVARAIVNQPSLVFADEPTANLDTKTTASLMELFLTLNRELKITFIFSSHDSRVLERAGRVIEMIDGRIADSDTLSSEANEESAQRISTLHHREDPVSTRDERIEPELCQRLV